MKRTLIFHSILKQEMDDFLRLRKSRGHRAERERYILFTLDQYLCGICHGSKNLCPDTIERWLASLPDEMHTNTKTVYISHYTQFARYLASFGYQAFIPERPVGNRSYVPYVFSEDEISALVKAADDTVLNIRAAGRRTAVCFSIILRMLVGCGFRLDEVLSLKTEDVSTDAGTVYIKSAKGNKDRIVPVHESLLRILEFYTQSDIPQKNGFLFPSRSGKKIPQAQARYYFNKYLKLAGIRKPDLDRYERNICIHCLRHTFAVMAFRKLASEGKDMYDEAPVLSTYMGHDRIYGTEKYLHMTAENSGDILSLMERFNEGVFPEVPE